MRRVPPAKYVHHVTLQSGHVRRSPRAEVPDSVVVALAPLVERALRGEHVPVPGFPAYTMRGGVEGRCIVITIYAAEDGAPVVTVGIATHSRCGAALWRRLHESSPGTLQPRATSPNNVPPEPWCAARLEAGAGLHADALDWAGDLERCLAWAWIEREATHARA